MWICAGSPPASTWATSVPGSVPGGCHRLIRFLDLFRPIGPVLRVISFSYIRGAGIGQRPLPRLPRGARPWKNEKTTTIALFPDQEVRDGPSTAAGHRPF